MNWLKKFPTLQKIVLRINFHDNLKAKWEEMREWEREREKERKLKSDPIAFPFAIYLSTSLALHGIASVVGISSHFVIASLEGVVERILQARRRVATYWLVCIKFPLELMPALVSSNDMSLRVALATIEENDCSKKFPTPSSANGLNFFLKINFPAPFLLNYVID